MTSKYLPMSAKVWNMKVDVDNTLLAIEVRNLEDHKVSFYIYDLVNKNWIWEDVQLEEQWWLNLSAITEKIIYLNYLANHTNPENTKSIAIDIENKKVLSSIGASKNNEENKSLFLPLHYKEGTNNFNTVARFISKCKGVNISKAVDYLETKSVIAISYYIYRENMLANYLLVTDNMGNEIDAWQIGAQLKAIGVETFFMAGNFLITVKDQKEIIICKV